MKFKKMVLLCAVSAAVSACQSGGSSMSLEEARKLSADFKVQNFKPAPRTTADLKKRFLPLQKIPTNCAAEIEKNRSNFQRTVDDMLASSHDVYAQIMRVSIAAEKAMSQGRFSEGLRLLNRAIASLPPSGQRVRKGTMYAQLARMYARVGDVSAANRELSLSMNEWIIAGKDWINKPKGQAYLKPVEAAIAQAEGHAAVAEQLYQKAIDITANSSSGNTTVNQMEIKAAHILTLVQQNRLDEAEAMARKVLISSWVSKSSKYDGDSAQVVAVLARTLMEQNRIDDARIMAEVALNMHEVSCSAPESVGLTQAREVLIDAYAGTGNWKGVLEQVNKARAELKGVPNLFERKFAQSFSYAEAEIRVGNADAGRKILQQYVDDGATSGGPPTFTSAQAAGLMALALSESGQSEEAYKLFSRSFPVLVSGGGGSAEEDTISGAGRVERIFDGYMALLTDLSRADSVDLPAGLDVPGELLRLASARRLGRVQRAFSAGWARAASGDEELSKLVRQEQDLSEEARALGETLSFMRSSPDAGDDLPDPAAMETRLGEIASARRTLLDEIENRFPEFAELTNPKPMSIADIRARLAPHQALVAYHVVNNNTYIWATKASGKLAFSVQNVGWETLKKDVAQLRKAVDPGPLGSLDDIPAFDVALSHGLYNKLLRSVREGWAGAQELLIVPHGPLGSLPFSMLATKSDVVTVDKSTLFERYKNVAWLVGQAAVTQLPSINALKGLGVTTRKQDKNRRPFIGIGDPYFSHQQQREAKAENVEVATRGLPFRSAPKTRGVDSAELSLLPRLPGTRAEIISIANALGADASTDLLLGDKATEQAVKSTDLSRYDVISFATHGLVPGDLNGLDQPALALTNPDIGKSEGDGLLTMNEILGLRLNADFAALSACNTATADDKGAEAVSGLGRAFFYAGARALLVSNWPVHSGATTDLMSKLFSSLAKDKSLTRSEALRRTKMAQIKKGGFESGGKTLFSYAHPIFWAPFSIVGDGGRSIAGKG
jgi:CHAT domain-containing protein